MSVKLCRNSLVISLLTLGTLYLSVQPMSLFATERVPEQLFFTSPQSQVSIVELYTSQGCSSCPPAERWLNSYVTAPKLWGTVIPMAFHVDYWDYIGWSDPFAKVEYSLRQHNYKRAGQINSVYTPGFVINGHEWRGWFSGKSLPKEAKSVGIIAVNIDRENLSLEYLPVISERITVVDKQNLDIHMALLGFGLETKVIQGENARKTLLEEFVVLAYEQRSYEGREAKIAWPKSNFSAQKYAIAVWLTKHAEQLPLQATGGYIPNGWLSAKSFDLEE